MLLWCSCFKPSIQKKDFVHRRHSQLNSHPISQTTDPHTQTAKPSLPRHPTQVRPRTRILSTEDISQSCPEPSTVTPPPIHTQLPRQRWRVKVDHPRVFQTESRCLLDGHGTPSLLSLLCLLLPPPRTPSPSISEDTFPMTLLQISPSSQGPLQSQGLDFQCPPPGKDCTGPTSRAPGGGC